jgi:hypothetical protein
MHPFSSHDENILLWRTRRCAAVFAGLALLVFVAGCRKSVRTDDPRLKRIQQMLDAQVPPGTREEKVRQLLKSKGYLVFPTQRPGTIVAVIPREEVDAREARITFYFDANGKLNTFESQLTSSVTAH